MSADFFKFAADNARREFQGWTQQRVGCHWDRGDFTISTRTMGKSSGYVVYHNREEIAFAPTFAEAAAHAKAAEAHVAYLKGEQPDPRD